MAKPSAAANEHALFRPTLDNNEGYHEYLYSYFYELRIDYDR